MFEPSEFLTTATAALALTDAVLALREDEIGPVREVLSAAAEFFARPTHTDPAYANTADLLRHLSRFVTIAHLELRLSASKD